MKIISPLFRLKRAINIASQVIGHTSTPILISFRCWGRVPLSIVEEFSG